MSFNDEDHAEKLIATTAWLMSRQGKIQEADVLRQSSASLVWFNKDWGVNYYNLHLEIDVSLYEQIMEYKDSLQTSILSVANELGSVDVGLEGVIIKPKLEAPSNWRENLQSLSSSQFGMPKPNTKYEADIFMLMPFKNNTLDIVYRDHICKLAEKLNLSIKRGDDFFTKHSIVEDIWSAINAANVIIADCTGRNPNVFYELGISHTLGKKSIMITQTTEDIPFDLQQWRHIKYESSSQGLKKLESELEEAILKLTNDGIAKGNDLNLPDSMNDIPF